MTRPAGRRLAPACRPGEHTSRGYVTVTEPRVCDTPSDSSPVEPSPTVYRWSKRPLEPWMDQAACKGLDRLFFGDSDRADSFTSRRERIREAKRICEGCPVRHQCGAYGADIPYGVWGGKTYSDVVRAKRKLKERHNG